MKKLKYKANSGFNQPNSIWQKGLFLLLFGLFWAPSVFAQKTVTGVVKGADGQGVPSASVVLKGTTTGTVTDLDGNFTIKVADDKAVLTITSVGLTTKEIAVGNQTNIVVKMGEDTKTLGEVVVIGYGQEVDRLGSQIADQRGGRRDFIVINPQRVDECLTDLFKNLFTTRHGFLPW